MANLNEQMRAGVSVQEVRDEYERQLNKRYEAGEAHVPVPDILWATVNAILARRQHGSAVQAVVHAWFHRGMVNFDSEEALAALDDGKGTPIPLFTAPPVADAARQADIATLRSLARSFNASGIASRADADAIDAIADRMSRRPAAEPEVIVHETNPSPGSWVKDRFAEQPAAAGNALTDGELSKTYLKAENHTKGLRAVADKVIEQHLRAAPQAAQGEGLTKAQVDEIVYRFRQIGEDTTYNIVNTAIAIAAHTRAAGQDGKDVAVMNAASGVIAAWDSSPVNNRDSLVTERIYELRQARDAAMQAKSAQGGA